LNHSDPLMAHPHAREPLTAAEADELAKACTTQRERLVIWTLLETGLRVSELCGLTQRDIQWQQRQIRVKGKGGPHGKRSKHRIVPLSNRARRILDWHFSDAERFPIGPRRVQKLVKEVAERTKIRRDVTPHVLRHTFAVLAL